MKQLLSIPENENVIKWIYFSEKPANANRITVIFDKISNTFLIQKTIDNEQDTQLDLYQMSLKLNEYMNSFM